jgi:hypothetical protein
VGGLRDESKSCRLAMRCGAGAGGGWLGWLGLVMGFDFMVMAMLLRDCFLGLFCWTFYKDKYLHGPNSSPSL